MSPAQIAPPPLHCYNMGHNGHGINLYGAVMTLVGNYIEGDILTWGTLSSSTPVHQLTYETSTNMVTRLDQFGCIFIIIQGEINLLNKVITALFLI